MQAAAHAGITLEINSHVNRLDLSDINAKLARQPGVRLMIQSNPHSRDALTVVRWGVTVARRAWLTPDDVLNTCHSRITIAAPPRRGIRQGARSSPIRNPDGHNKIAEIRRLLLQTNGRTVRRTWPGR